MIESALGLSPRVGLGEVLAGSEPLADALSPAPGIPGLTVLPIKDLPLSPADLLASEKLASLLNTLCEQFEHVVIDSPPILSFSDALMLASLSDGVILVTRY